MKLGHLWDICGTFVGHLWDIWLVAEVNVNKNTNRKTDIQDIYMYIYSNMQTDMQFYHKILKNTVTIKITLSLMFKIIIWCNTYMGSQQKEITEDILAGFWKPHFYFQRHQKNTNDL